MHTGGKVNEASFYGEKNAKTRNITSQIKFDYLSASTKPGALTIVFGCLSGQYNSLIEQNGWDGLVFAPFDKTKSAFELMKMAYDIMKNYQRMICDQNMSLFDFTGWLYYTYSIDITSGLPSDKEMNQNRTDDPSENQNNSSDVGDGSSETYVAKKARK